MRIEDTGADFTFRPSPTPMGRPPGGPETPSDFESAFAPDATPDATPDFAPGPTPGAVVYESRTPWRPENPKALVIACSDGRHDEHLDEFLQRHLRLACYDRVYLPGGPGGLAGGASEYLRADHIQRECGFLVDAHDIEEVVIVFHGAAEGGPEEAACGDYQRKYPSHSCADLNRQQDADLADTLRASFPWLRKVRLRAFRSEVTADNLVRFVQLEGK